MISLGVRERIVGLTCTVGVAGSEDKIEVSGGGAEGSGRAEELFD